MNPSGIRSNKIEQNKRLHILFLTLAMLSFSLNGADAKAATLTPSDYRVARGGEKFDDIWQYAVAFKLRPPRRLRARYLELAVGSISSSEENRAFVSLGPVWQWPIDEESFFVQLGFSPTLISGSSFNGRDLGGNVHFTSSAAIGATFGRLDTVSLSLRFQHTSNGGLSSTNPGLDMVGLSLAFNFDDL